MDKELLEILKSINKNLEKLDAKECEFIINKIEEAYNEPATISIEKDADGTAKTHIEGKTLAILVTLAGVEKTILEKFNTPKSVWELIKSLTGIKEEDNE